MREPRPRLALLVLSILVPVAPQDIVVRTLAGTNLAESVDGLAAYARFHTPSGIAISADGDTLFVKGQRSRYVRSIHLQEISSKFPRFTLQSIADCGHWVHAEKPQETCDVVREFLDRGDVA